MRRLRAWTIRAFRSLVLTSIEAFLALLCILAALPVLLAPSSVRPDSLLSQIPLWLEYMWGANLLLGGVLTLVGIVVPLLRVEQAGVFILGSVGAVFTYITISVGGVFAETATGAVIYAAFSLAFYARFIVLGRVIRILNQYLGGS